MHSSGSTTCWKSHGVWCLVDDTVKAEGLYSLIPGLLKLAIGTWNAM